MGGPGRLVWIIRSSQSGMAGEEAENCVECLGPVWEKHRQAGNREKLAEVQARQARHDADHLGEREYAEDTWTKGEHQPRNVTALNMDAPTEEQFDVPTQQRTAYDPLKSLEGAKKWSSKITGLMMAGLGMLAFVSSFAVLHQHRHLHTQC